MDSNSSKKVDYNLVKTIKNSAEQLIQSVEDGFNLKNAAEDLQRLRFQIYDKLEGEALENFKQIVPWVAPDTILDTNSATYYDQAFFEDSKQRLLHSIRRLVVWLDGYVTDFEGKIEKLKKDLVLKNKEAQDFKKRNDELLDIIIRSKEDKEFKPKKEDYELFKNGHLKFFDEAVNCFNSKCFIACIAMCGELLESFVNEACKTSSISEGTLGAKIQKLKEKAIIKGHDENLVNICKHYRERSLHVTSEDITPEKSLVALNSLIVLAKELFKK